MECSPSGIANDIARAQSSGDKSTTDAGLLDHSLKPLQESEGITQIQNGFAQTVLSGAHRSAESPILGLPDEILQEIFLYCLPHSRNPTMSPRDAPLLLCHICSRWRHVAWATPVLWSALHIPSIADSAAVSSPEVIRRERVTLIEEWVRRSGDYPLSFSIAPVNLGHTLDAIQPNAHDVQRLFTLLSPTWRRWTCVDLVWAFLNQPVDHMNGLATYFPPDPLRHVRKLRLHLTFGMRWKISEQLIRFLEHLTLTANKNLIDLSLSVNLEQTGFDVLSLTRYLPCAQLRVLKLQDPTDKFDDPRFVIIFHLAFEILRECPNLTVFSVNYTSRPPIAAFPRPYSQITNTHLKDLSLSFQPSFNDICPSWLVPMLHWPSLTTLHLRDPDSKRTIIQGPVYAHNQITFIQGVGATLTSLKMRTTLDFFRYLEHLPVLVKLHLETDLKNFETYNKADSDKPGVLRWTTSAEQTMRLLTPGGRGHGRPTSHYCQNLQFLTWEGYTFFTDQTLLKLLVNRAEAAMSVVPMKEVRVVFCRERQEDIVPACAKLLADGLKLHLEYPTDDVGWKPVIRDSGNETGR